MSLIPLDSKRSKLEMGTSLIFFSYVLGVCSIFVLSKNDRICRSLLDYLCWNCSREALGPEEKSGDSVWVTIFSLSCAKFWVASRENLETNYGSRRVSIFSITSWLASSRCYSNEHLQSLFTSITLMEWTSYYITMTTRDRYMEWINAVWVSTRVRWCY